jgi:hypothetical protein
MRAIIHENPLFPNFFIIDADAERMRMKYPSAEAALSMAEVLRDAWHRLASGCAAVQQLGARKEV